jgi:hypothetical protein
MTAGNARVRLAEPVAALSLATDLGMGQPLEQALRTCLLAVAAGSALGLDGPTHSDTYYFALLRFVGCTSDAHEQAVLVGGARSPTTPAWRQRSWARCPNTWGFWCGAFPPALRR